MNDYPDNWDEIAHRIKSAAGWRCERCGHPNCRKTGHVLTVHHLVPDKALCEDWNLAALCQRCHLSIQARVNMFQDMLPGMPASKWFLPHLAGFLLWRQKQRLAPINNAVRGPQSPQVERDTAAARDAEWDQDHREAGD